MSLEVKIERPSPSLAILAFTGAMTHGFNLTVADSQVRQLLSEGVTVMVFDLTAVPHADSSGLGLIVHTYGLLNSHNGTLRVAGTSQRVLELFSLTKSDTFLALDPTREASLAALPQ